MRENGPNEFHLSNLKKMPVGTLAYTGGQCKPAHRLTPVTTNTMASLLLLTLNFPLLAL